MSIDTLDPTTVDDDQVPDPDYDPAAPYGRNPKNGKPYTMSPEDRMAMGKRLADARAAAAASGRLGRRKSTSRAPASKSSAPRKPAGPDYRLTALGLLQLVSFGLGLAGRFMPSLALDSATVTLHAEPLADAVHATALDSPALAAILERAGQVGPWSALLMAALPVALQIGANHGMVQPNDSMGILTPDQLITEITAMGSKNG